MLKRPGIGNGTSKLNEEDTTGDGCEARFSEWKTAAYALFISLCILTAKTFLTHKKALHEAIWEKKYVYFESVLADGRVMGQYVSELSMKTSGVVIPLLCGLGMTLFTWLIIYLDSSVPGIQPPTPFSPNKYKVRSGHSFHLGYVFSIVNGFMVFFVMVTNNFFNAS